MANKLSFEELLKKIQENKQEIIDLSCDEDLSIALMNLISIEEHLFFTGAKTGKDKYFELLDAVRTIRKELLAKMIKDPEGEIWCISKHLLASSMRLIEVGTKIQAQGKTEEARAVFMRAYELYSLFWGLNLKLVDTATASVLSENKQESALASNSPEQKSISQKNILQKLGDLVKKVVDCCIE